MNITEETTVVINGVMLNPDQVKSLWTAAQMFKLKLQEDGGSEDWILKSSSDRGLPRIRSVVALFDLSVHE